MSIFSIFTLLGGLAFFLYGMNVMSDGLEKMAGGKLELMLKKMTSSKLKSLALGAGITIAIQSSSALTVMLVGLVNSGIMELGQTIGVIMGSNVGTTLTAWILSLAGIESNNFFLQMLKPESFSPIVALIGVLLIMGGKKTRQKDIGRICVGFAVLMYGMELMKDSVSPLSEMPEFESVLTAFRNPILGVIVGTVFTGIIQSSSASVGILQALSLTGSVTFGAAIPIIMGQNIGTCVTSLISSIGVSKNAKRVSVVHIAFNLIGTIVFLLIFYGLGIIIPFGFLEDAINPVGIALCHTIFNILTTAFMLPFSKQLEKLARRVIRAGEEEKKEGFLDERLLAHTTFAINECHAKTVDMGRLVKKIMFEALDCVHDYDLKRAEGVREQEQAVDGYEDQLGTFMVKLSSKPMSRHDSGELTQLLHMIGDFERIGDFATYVIDTADELHQKQIQFSSVANEEVRVATAAVKEIVDITLMAFETDNVRLAQRVDPLEDVIEEVVAEIRDHHIERLKDGVCTIESGFILTDLLTYYDRIASHCSNITECMIQKENNLFEKHNNINKPKKADPIDYESAVQLYKDKYRLPDLELMSH